MLLGSCVNWVVRMVFWPFANLILVRGRSAHIGI